MIANRTLKDAKSSQAVDVFEAADVSVELIDDVIDVVRNFKNSFFIETEIKTKESHEKSG